LAENKGDFVERGGPPLVYPALREETTNQLQIASAGFQGQWIVSKAALCYREHHHLSDHGNNFTAGVVAFHLAATAAYTTVLKNHKKGGMVGTARATGLSTDQVALLAVIPSLLDGWRLFAKGPPAWVPALSAGVKGVGILAIWQY
jgi:hypothetical protein